MAMSPQTLLATTALVLTLAWPVAGESVPSRFLVVAVDDDTGGAIATMEVRRPWSVRTDLVRVGRQTVLHAHGALVYAVSPEEGAIREIDPRRGKVLRAVFLGPNTLPQDVLVVDGRRAYVSRLDAKHLLRIDLRTGAATEAVDLSPFGDADGLPEATRLATDGRRLFVQLQRRDRDTGLALQPSILAVVDLATERLVDVDRRRPGVQGIELAGTFPKMPMQVFTPREQMLLAATGGDFDHGGLELVDTRRLRSLGLLVREADGLTGSDLGAFVGTRPRAGFLVFTTDLTLSSHLHRFDADGVDPEELAVTVDYFAPTLILDAPTRQLFFPDGGAFPPGIRVFDSRTGRPLSEGVVETGGRPSDLVLVGGAL